MKQWLGYSATGILIWFLLARVLFDRKAIQDDLWSWFIMAIILGMLSGTAVWGMLT